VCEGQCVQVAYGDRVDGGRGVCLWVLECGALFERDTHVYRWRIYIFIYLYMNMYIYMCIYIVHCTCTCPGLTVYI